MKIRIQGARISAMAWPTALLEPAFFFLFKFWCFIHQRFAFFWYWLKILHWNIIYLDYKLFGGGGNSLKKFALKEKPLVCSLVLALHLGLLRHLSSSFSASAMSSGPVGLFGSSDLHRECFLFVLLLFSPCWKGWRGSLFPDQGWNLRPLQ